MNGLLIALDIPSFLELVFEIELLSKVCFLFFLMNDDEVLPIFAVYLSYKIMKFLIK